MLGALLALTAGVVAGQSPSPAPRRSEADALCAARQQSHETKRMSGRGWRAKIGLDPCVSMADARKILSAIHDKRLQDRQRPATPGLTAGPRPVPDLRMSQILWIALADDRQFEAVPEARVVVSTRDVTSSTSGLTLFLAVRGDDVELRLVSGWIE